MKTHVFAFLALCLTACSSDNQKNKETEKSENLEEMISATETPPEVDEIQANQVAGDVREETYRDMTEDTATIQKEQTAEVEQYFNQ